MRQTPIENSIERWFGRFDGIRNGVQTGVSIALRMLRGTYLVSEKRTLYEKLGKLVFERSAERVSDDAEVKTLLHQLERTNKKLELEERLIRNLRFGYSRKSKEAGAQDDSVTP